MLLDSHHSDTNNADKETNDGRNKVEDGEGTRGKYVEDKNNACALSNIEHSMLDRIEEWQNDGETDDVIKSMADGGDDEEIVKLIITTGQEVWIVIISKEVWEYPHWYQG